MNNRKYRRDSITCRKVFPMLPVGHFVCKAIFQMVIVTLLSSCIHRNFLGFYVDNKTEDTIKITTASIIPIYTVGVCNIKQSQPGTMSNSYNVIYSYDKDTLFLLPPNTRFRAERYWSTRDVLSDYNTNLDGETPGWMFIKKIKVGNQYLSPERWNSEKMWHVTYEYEDIEREYTLTVTR